LSPPLLALSLFPLSAYFDMTNSIVIPPQLYLPAPAPRDVFLHLFFPVPFFLPWLIPQHLSALYGQRTTACLLSTFCGFSRLAFQSARFASSKLISSSGLSKLSSPLPIGLWMPSLKSWLSRHDSSGPLFVPSMTLETDLVESFIVCPQP